MEPADADRVLRPVAVETLRLDATLPVQPKGLVASSDNAHWLSNADVSILVAAIGPDRLFQDVQQRVCTSLSIKDHSFARQNYKAQRIERNVFAGGPDAAKQVRAWQAIDVGEVSPEAQDVRAVLEHVVEAAGC